VHSQSYEKQMLVLPCVAIHPSFCPHGTAWLLLDRFLWNFILAFLPKSVEIFQFGSDCWCCVPEGHPLLCVTKYTYFLIVSPSLSSRQSVYIDHVWNVLQCGETCIHHFLCIFSCIYRIFFLAPV